MELVPLEPWDPCQYVSNCELTPPLTQQQSTDNKLGLMLGRGYVRTCSDTDIDPSLVILW